MENYTEKTSSFITDFFKQEEKKEEKQAVELSDDELAMLEAYRKFRYRNVPGSVFSWQSPFTKEIVYPSDCSLIQDPRDVSKVRV